MVDLSDSAPSVLDGYISETEWETGNPCPDPQRITYEKAIYRSPIQNGCTQSLGLEIYLFQKTDARLCDIQNLGKADLVLLGLFAAFL